MLFNSYPFIFAFLPILLAAFALTKKIRPGWTAGVLTIASLIFYAWNGILDLPILLLSITVNFAAGRAIAVHPSKPLLTAAIGFNLLLLGWYKYAAFIAHAASQAFAISLPDFSHHLPIGISFYTFTQIAFLVDSYVGRAKEYRFINYALFVTYFPHLIAGPILHHREMMPQFDHLPTRRQRVSDIVVGGSIFIIGLAKKILVADTLAQFVDPVFTAIPQGMQVSFGEAWMAALTYALQIYFDFSGYCDMAIGLSCLFGVKLPLNFASPYKARSMIEFWRCWHMTLSRFLRDYLYIPLGGNRLGEARRYLNLLATMIIGGLWHGANWTFLVWGTLHGLFLAINHLWIKVTPTAQPGLIRKGIAHGLTLACVIALWVFFRADTIDSALKMLSVMVSPGGVPNHLLASLFGLPYVALFPNGLFIIGKIPIALTLGIGWGLALWAPNTQQIMARYLSYADAIPAHLSWRPTLTWACVLATVFVLCLSGMSTTGPFMYFNF